MLHILYYILYHIYYINYIYSTAMALDPYMIISPLWNWLVGISYPSVTLQEPWREPIRITRTTAVASCSFT